MFIILFFILGLIFGSFINCLAYRLKHKKTILGRSFCPKCKHSLNFLDLFPLFSYIFLKARCRYCKKRISFEYFLVELATGLIFGFGYYFYFLSSFYSGDNIILAFVFYLIMSIFLIIIFIYDLKYYLVLDKIIWPAIVIAFIFNLILRNNLLYLLLAAGIGFLFFWLQFKISKGKWIGGGDVLIGILIGFLVGWPKVLLVIFISYIIGSIIGIILLILKKKQWSSKIPFGPFLVFSTWLVILFGDIILDWYVVSARGGSPFG